MKKVHFDNFIGNDIIKFKGDISSCFDYSNIENDGFIVQGFCVTDKYYLVTAYYHKCEISKNSRVYFYDKFSGQCFGYVVLDNKAHVGGIGYDHENGIIFVTGSKGKINTYTYDSFIESLNGNHLVRVESNIDISSVINGNVSAATVYYYNYTLYVATCSCSGCLIRFDLKYDDKKIIVTRRSICNCLPPCIQGLVVFTYNNKNYFLVSQSYSKLKSVIKVFDFDNRFLGQKIIGFRGLEGIDMDINGNIHGIFEFGLNKSLVFNISELNKGINKFLEYKYVCKGKIHQKKLDNMK